MNRSKPKVAVAMSGGVDSSVAAAILLDRGYDVTGITMSKYDDFFQVNNPLKNSCYGPGENEAIRGAEHVCKDLNIPLYVIDVRTEFRKSVIEYFRREYLCGRTPNPCIACNRIVKFGFLFKKAQKKNIGFEYFATGHYARIEKKEERYLLKKGRDTDKDQSYFLYTLTREQLSRTMFPLGEYRKNQVREMARSYGLEIGDKAESQDFVGQESYSLFFNENEIRPGEIVGKDGEILGRHKGIIYYTIGQRKGLGIASQRPLYVNHLDAPNNRIVVGDRVQLYSRGLLAKDINLTGADHDKKHYSIMAKIRYKHRPARATARLLENKRARIMFEEPQLSITPGQSMVMYVDDLVLGGGIIDEAIP